MKNQKFKVIKNTMTFVLYDFHESQIYELTMSGVKDGSNFLWTSYLKYDGDSLFDKWVSYLKKVSLTDDMFKMELVEEEVKTELHDDDIVKIDNELYYIKITKGYGDDNVYYARSVNGGQWLLVGKDINRLATTPTELELLQVKYRDLENKHNRMCADFNKLKDALKVLKNYF